MAIIGDEGYNQSMIGLNLTYDFNVSEFFRKIEVQT